MKERGTQKNIMFGISDQSVWIFSIYIYIRLRQMMQLIAFKCWKLLSLGAEFFSLNEIRPFVVRFGAKAKYRRLCGNQWCSEWEITYLQLS
jgi:hypothetical protein